ERAELLRGARSVSHDLGGAAAASRSHRLFHGAASTSVPAGGRFRERLYGRTICTLTSRRYRESAARRRPRRSRAELPRRPPGGVDGHHLEGALLALPRPKSPQLDLWINLPSTIGFVPRTTVTLPLL